MSDTIIKTEGKKVSDKKRTSIFLNINVSCIATSMLGTALTTALPPIMKDLNISVNTGQWLTSGFALFLAVMTPFTAYLITRFRTKKLYCTAIGFFIVGLTICACSNNFWTMMLGRIIQGCGNGLLSSMAQVIILTIFPPERIGTIMGWYGLSIGVAPIISPTIAGLLVDSVGWRMIFIIAISIMLVSLICAIFIFEDVLPTMNKHFDVISLFFSALAFGDITLAVGNMGTYDFVSYQVLLALIIGVITSIIFVWRQLHIKVPFLDVRVLKNKDYSISLTATVILQLILMGSAIIFPVYVQQIKGYSATISGLVVLPGSLAMAVISPFAGKIYDKIGMKLLFIIGSSALAIGNLAIYFIDIHQSVWIIASVNILRCLSFGSLLMPLVTWAMKDIPKTKASDATALFNSIRFIGGAVGSALFISIMTKVANAVVDTKENPKMYGINIVFLIMSILSVIILLLGIFACKQSPTKKNVKDQEKEKEMKELSSDDKLNIDIVIADEKASNKKSTDTISETDTIIYNEISIDELSIKDKSDTDTIIEEPSIDEITPKADSEIEVIINNDNNKL
ncbi:MFS general substrate transporter [Neocallimastix lanati (nom. inval.)]|jgi:EmrB/QacA subfamily drug resistance transporter|uniref:MFS general substrate transporter n=1 Tax=Neocallimastix californiae TaxID=1754190 RepID=A0A1Y2DZ54_9FUNG|nr:MFS general substrate transporter [Neocallimastix sp. JGI-2020a]ORY64588.1 MFS general substrate transporter [Neocallimastix californiae]|eukprot:ORY64588.1 MFS general substrate transporter [Neocallimastix californiae]